MRAQILMILATSASLALSAAGCGIDDLAPFTARDFAKAIAGIEI